MAKQTGITGADSCWEDGFDEDADCEKYLQARKTKIVAEERLEEGEEDEDNGDGDEAEEESAEEYEAVAEANDAEDDEENDESDDDDDNDESDDVADEAESDDTADEDEEPSEATSTKGRKMVKAKTGGKVTKADAIRAIIEAKQNAGVEIRPRDIIEALNKKGIAVNASQVSITLRAMGVPPAKRGGGGGRPPKARPAEVAPKSRATAKIRAVEPKHDGVARDYDNDEIEKATELLRATGSYESAVSLLGLCHKIMQRS